MKAKKTSHRPYAAQSSAGTAYSAASRPTAPVMGWASASVPRILNRPARMPGPAQIDQTKKRMPVPVPPRGIEE